MHAPLLVIPQRGNVLHFNTRRTATSASQHRHMLIPETHPTNTSMSSCGQRCSQASSHQASAAFRPQACRPPAQHPMTWLTWPTTPALKSLLAHTACCSSSIAKRQGHTGAWFDSWSALDWLLLACAQRGLLMRVAPRQTGWAPGPWPPRRSRGTGSGRQPAQRAACCAPAACCRRTSLTFTTRHRRGRLFSEAQPRAEVHIASDHGHTIHTGVLPPQQHPHLVICSATSRLGVMRKRLAYSSASFSIGFSWKLASCSAAGQQHRTRGNLRIDVQTPDMHDIHSRSQLGSPPSAWCPYMFSE